MASLEDVVAGAIPNVSDCFPKGSDNTQTKDNNNSLTKGSDNTQTKDNNNSLTKGSDNTQTKDSDRLF